LHTDDLFKRFGAGLQQGLQLLLPPRGVLKGPLDDPVRTRAHTTTHTA